MFCDSSVRNFRIRVVDDCVALVVTVLDGVFEAKGSIIEFTVFVVEVFVDLTRVDDTLAHLLPLLSILEEVFAESEIHTFEQTVKDVGVAVDRDSLERVIEIVVVEIQSNGKALDDRRRKVGRLAHPLFLGVAVDESLVDLSADLREDPLFQIARALTGNANFFQLAARLVRRVDSPQLVQRHQVDRKRENFPVVVHLRSIHKAVERRESIHKVPDALVRRVKDVGTIDVDVYSFTFLSVTIAADVAAFVNDKDLLTLEASLVSED